MTKKGKRKASRAGANDQATKKFGIERIRRIMHANEPVDRATATAMLIVAAHNCLVKAAEWAIEAGANVRADGDLPILVAAHSGAVEIFNMLVAKGADPYACNHHALKAAGANGHAEIIEAIATIGYASKQAKDMSMALATMGDHIDAATNLALFGADIMLGGLTLDKKGRTNTTAKNMLIGATAIVNRTGITRLIREMINDPIGTLQHLLQ